MPRQTQTMDDEPRNRETTVEIEGKGLDYERYALNRLFHRLVREYAIGSVVEIPAKGEKAMPSLYSLAFAEAGCAVTLVNSEPKSHRVWTELGFDVTYRECPDLTQTSLPDASADIAFNFLHLAQYAQRSRLLAEMARLTRRYVLFISVNRFNPGFFSHRAVHRYFKVPWKHGDIRFMNTFAVRRYFREQGLRIVEAGLVDTPPYPDSLGFRDMRLHRKNINLNKADWESRTVAWMKTGRYPLKIRLQYLVERLPAPFFLKLLYAHLFYVLAERPRKGP